jgi:hypothetical protein
LKQSSCEEGAVCLNYFIRALIGRRSTDERCNNSPELKKGV